MTIDSLVKSHVHGPAQLMSKSPIMKESVSNKHESVFAKAAWACCPSCWRLWHPCLNSRTLALGTCVLLEPDSSHQRWPVFTWAAWRVQAEGSEHAATDRPQLSAEGAETGLQLCAPRAHHACCQRAPAAQRSGSPPSSWLPSRARPRDLCILCCVIKLSFAFKVPRPVIIQAILAKILGPCSFELQGQRGEILLSLQGG